MPSLQVQLKGMQVIVWTCTPIARGRIGEDMVEEEIAESNAKVPCGMVSRGARGSKLPFIHSLVDDSLAMLCDDKKM